MKLTKITFNLLIVLALTFGMAGCSKNLTTETWIINAIIELGGSFEMNVICDIEIDGGKFTATVKSEDDDAIDFTMTGKVQDGTKLIFDNTEFTLKYPEYTEDVTLNGEATIADKKISGSGTVESVISSFPDQINKGTFTCSGTKE